MLMHTCACMSVDIYNIIIHACALGAPQSARNHLGQPYMHADVLHKMAREVTDTEHVGECTHSQAPSDDGATGLCFLGPCLAPCPVSVVLCPPLCCSRATQEPFPPPPPPTGPQLLLCLSLRIFTRPEPWG